MLKTRRLIVRRFGPDDSEDLYRYLSDPRVVRYEPYGVLTREECRLEALRRERDASFWAVCLKEDGRLIGNLYFADHAYGTNELGFVFRADVQGKGYAFESAFAMIDDAVRRRRVRRVEAFCNPENERSWRLLERLHMRREGWLKENVCFRYDGRGEPVWQDTYQYAILAREWLALYGKEEPPYTLWDGSCEKQE